jgi:hypothetical protein
MLDLLVCESEVNIHSVQIFRQIERDELVKVGQPLDGLQLAATQAKSIDFLAFLQHSGDSRRDLPNISVDNVELGNCIRLTSLFDNSLDVLLGLVHLLYARLVAYINIGPERGILINNG